MIGPLDSWFGTYASPQGRKPFRLLLFFGFPFPGETWGTCCRLLGDRLHNSHSAVVCRRVVGRELTIRTSRKPRLLTYIAAEYAQTFGT